MRMKFSIWNVIVVGLAITLIGCGGGPPAIEYHFTTNDYDVLDSSFDWDAVDAALGDSEVLPVELVKGQLVVLKKKHRSARRDLKSVKCAGAILR